MLEAEGEVDVFYAVQQIKQVRPEFVATEVNAQFDKVCSFMLFRETGTVSAALRHRQTASAIKIEQICKTHLKETFRYINILSSTSLLLLRLLALTVC
jgi:hypothetical protein